MAAPERVLIVDNGSYECRVGWHSSAVPELRFRNVLTKPRKDRKKDNNAAPADVPELAELEIQVGNDITNIEAVRAHLKSPFERNVITNWNHQEQIFDYIFAKMGYEGEPNIGQPIVLTEALANPNFCRQQMNELLFECYGLPALSYGIDALYSWQHFQRKEPIPDALIVSIGYSTTHVIPVLDGCLQMEHVRRLNVGGYHIITFLYRLMQMKYPVHLNAITISRMEKLVHDHCHIAIDYKAELLQWAHLDFYDAHIMKIQLPYNAVTASNALLTAEQKLEKRRELAMRLLDLKQRREREKQQEDEEQLQLLQRLRQLYETNKLLKFERALQQQQISNLEELDEIMGTVSARIAARNKERPARPTTSKQDKQEKLVRPPEGVSQTQWLSTLREKREELLRRKQARQQQRQEQTKRHTHAAQERMRIISTLARNEKRKKDDADDGFGMNDEDWDVYKRINRYKDDSDSDADQEQLLECEKILSHYEEETGNVQVSPLNAAENYQLHFGLEAIRVPELLFQPSMIGCPEAGLAELIDFVLKLFNASEQQRMVEHIFLTGGCAQFRGLRERLNKELLALRPFQSEFVIHESKEPSLGAWLGACDLAKQPNFEETLTTRQQYQEQGSEFFKQHKASNLFYPTPKD